MEGSSEDSVDSAVLRLSWEMVGAVKETGREGRDLPDSVAIVVCSYNKLQMPCSLRGLRMPGMSHRQFLL